MPLSPGTRLGPYEVVALVGVGGMGEVYRARDTKLNRDVAVKVLLPTVANDPDRLARFTREAQLLASLNHPNIASIYGMEQRALVMELVDGPTLADRIARGAIPLDEALPIAGQIAEALEAAHEQGIIHRDLKPANIKVRPDGTVKVLDFGLAKALEAPAGIAAPAHISQSPTLTSPAMTQAGVILGTAAYMSPEQAAGKSADRRSDLWSFGVVLFEVLTGRPVFAGESVAHVLASVLKTEPDWSALPADTPASVRRLLRRCLEKDRKQRLSDAAAARLEIQDAADRTSEGAPPQMIGSRKSWLSWATAATGFALAAVLGGILMLRDPLPEQSSYRLQFVVPEGLRLTGAMSGRASLSPDGRYLAFAASATGQNQIWVRTLATLDTRPLKGTEGASEPFWSPDSRTLGFVTGGALRRVDIAGGAVTKICDAPGAGSGASWSSDGVILVGSGNAAPSSGLRRVSAGGGTLEPATALDASNDEDTHSYPFFLPDGHHFLYRALSNNNEDRGVFVGSLDSTERTRLLVSGSNAVYASGYLIFLSDTELMAQALDLGTRTLRGEAIRVAERLVVGGASGRTGAFSASADGLLAFHTGVQTTGSRLTWIDRSGRVVRTIGDPANYRNPRLSPDGNRVAVEIRENGRSDIWLMDVARGLSQRFTSDPLGDIQPLWSHDGNRIVFIRSRQAGAGASLHMKSSNGTGTETTLVELKTTGGLADLATAGDIVFQQGVNNSLSLWRLPPGANPTPTPLVASSFDNRHGRVSPDGRWLAYVSTEAGTSNVYLQEFPDAKTKTRVSGGGGIQPLWRRDGKEVYYLDPEGKLIAVPITLTAGSPVIGEAIPLFQTHVENGGVATGGFTQQYDVAENGQRFLVNELVNRDGEDPITIVVNWTAGLQRATAR